MWAFLAWGTEIVTATTLLGAPLGFVQTRADTGTVALADTTAVRLKRKPVPRAGRSASPGKAEALGDTTSSHLAATPTRAAASEPALPAGVSVRIPETLDRPEPTASALGEPLLVELRVGNLARRMIRAYWRGGPSPYVPAAEVLRLVELPVNLTPERLETTVPGQAHPLVLDGHSGTVSGGDLPAPAMGVLVDERGNLLMTLERLGTLLDTGTGFDLDQATATILPAPSLPVVRRHARDQARAALNARPADYSVSAPKRLDASGGGGLVMDYNVQSSSDDPVRDAAYDVALAGPLARGVTSGRIRGSGTGDRTTVDLAWNRMLPTNRWLTQIRVGDGVVTGPRPEPSRGFSLTNAPPYRPMLVEALPFSGSLPPGWNLEAYRAGELVAFDSIGAEGRYSLTLPIRYGENPIDFVAYGPFGEIKTFNQTFRALPSMLRAGEWEYGISAGACRIDRCSWNGNADVRVGVSRRLTIRGGIDYRQGETGGLVAPYALATAAPLNAVGVELEAVRSGFARASLRYEPSVHLRITGDAIAYANDSAFATLGIVGRSREWRVYGRWAPLARSTGPALELTASQIHDLSGVETDLRAGISWMMANTMLRPYLRSESRQDTPNPYQRGYVGIGATVLPIAALGPTFGRMWLQSNVELTSGGRLWQADALLVRNLSSAFRLEAGFRWSRLQTGTSLTLSLVSQLPTVRYSASASTATGGGGSRLNHTVGGSMVWDGSTHRVQFSAEPALDRTGISGVVFLDLDANGRQDEGEPSLEGVRILMAGRALVTDSSGRFQMWGLQPYEPVSVAVDTASLAVPQWVPAFANPTVVPEPSRFAHIAVPILVGAVVEGRLEVASPSGAELLDSPIPLILIDHQRGDRREVQTFRDGTFYLMGVRPGHYTLTADSTVLGTMGLAATPITLEVPSLGAPGAKPASWVLSDVVLPLRAVSQIAVKQPQ